jgi:hypothetical protein
MLDNSFVVVTAERWPIVKASGWLSILLSTFKENILACTLVYLLVQHEVVNEICPLSAHILHSWCFAIYQYGRMMLQSLSKGTTSNDCSKIFLVLQHKGNCKEFTSSGYYFIAEVGDLEMGIPFNHWNFVLEDKAFIQKCCSRSCIEENLYYSLFVLGPVENHINDWSWSMVRCNQVSLLSC